MSKNRPSKAAEKPDTRSATKSEVETDEGSGRTMRETIESIVIAFILAFLFRTFEAEAFVIPTGSMAPTLMGRHKDVICPECGYDYRAGDSESSDPNPNVLEQKVGATLCPMCGYVLEINPYNGDHKSFTGDRILVSKFSYDLEDPERWDVIVFRFPGDPKTNYIKRLIGLPGETVWIDQGDIYIGPSPVPDDWKASDFQIQRKPPFKLRAMMQDVYDTDYVIPRLIQAGFPQRWEPWTEGDPPASGGWQPTPDGGYKSYSTDGSASQQDVWLRYRHIMPDDEVWRQMLVAEEAGKPPRLRDLPQPAPIQDSYAYNTTSGFSVYRPFENRRMNWVGDLMVECQAKIAGNSGEVLLELVEGGVLFTCRIDVATGEATLIVNGNNDEEARAAIDNTGVRGPGTYELAFAQADDQLVLWVDGRAVCAQPMYWTGQKIVFDPGDGPAGALENHDLHRGESRRSDLAPVRIGSRGAAITLSHLQVKRDIYYLSPEEAGGFARAPNNFDVDRDAPGFYPLAADQFFVLGDNSPMSADGRYWLGEGGKSPHLSYYVPRDALIGKALFIYWPHALRHPLPFTPNFGRMGFVR